MRGQGASGCAPTRSIENPPHAGPARPAQSKSGWSPQWRARAGGDPERAQGVGEDRGVGLADAHHGADGDGLEAPGDPQAGQDLPQARVPIADHGQAQPGRRQVVERREGVRDELEAQALDQDVGQARRAAGRRGRAPRPARAAQSRRSAASEAASRPRSWWRAVEADLARQGRGHPVGRVGDGPPPPAARAGAPPGRAAPPGCRRRRGAPPRRRPVPPGIGVRRHAMIPRRRAAIGVRGMRVTRRRIVSTVAVVVVAALAWVPAVIADHYADGPGGAEVGHARLDRGWEFVYHAVRLSRGARLGTEDSALERARERWAGPPAVGRSVRLVYMDGPFTVPVPEGGAEPAPERRDGGARSRASAGSCAGRVRGGPASR